MAEDYIINNLIGSLQRLPSVGYRTAKRIALNILQNRDEVIKPLLDSLSEAYLKIRKCSLCGNFTSREICGICSDEKRDRQTICVVENIIDLWAIENVNIHNGLYHILDGTLSAVEGRGVEVLRIEKLIEKIKNYNAREVIIATNPTSEGQTTAFYIASHLEGFNLRISQPALGVPMGSELNYLDDSTLNIAFKNKKEF
ncbi:MAG: recombination mediator RecR [Rickettsiales bacterium]|jgi:recombination protein RecR|nr:recombination mediator RecR [Rickettsiales bacterium]